MRDEMERLSTMRSREINRIRDQDVDKRSATVSAATRSPIRGVASASVSQSPLRMTLSGPQNKTFVIGSGILKNRHTAYTDTLVAFDIFTDIGTAYPAGFLAPIINLNYELNKTQRYLKCTATGAGHTIMVDNDNNVYGFGLADAGELGNGVKDTSSRPCPIALTVLQSKLRQDEMRHSKGLLLTEIHSACR